MRGFRVGDKVENIFTGDQGKIFKIHRQKNSREIVPMGIGVDWDEGSKTTTWQYAEDLKIINVR